MKNQPTKEQLAALRNFATNEGRNWKSALRHCWETGDYPRGCDSASLQQVRNTFGPSWLVAFRLPGETLSLPSMEFHAVERIEARAEETARQLTAIMNQPLGSISSKSGRIERESPLFFGSGENPTLF